MCAIPITIHQKKNPAVPGSFSGFESFYRSLLERGEVNQREKCQVKEWMKGNGTYTKHRPARRRFQTNSFFKYKTVVNLYVYMEFDNMLEITKNRNVIFDYTV